MMAKRNIISNLIKIAVSAVLVVAVVFSQIPSDISADNRFVADPTGTYEGMAAFLYDNKTGLPTSEANAIAETSDGFLWIGSYGGLIRYDGSTFERFRSTTGIASVVSLFVDSRENLWIGTNDNGAAVMDRYGNIKMYGKQDGIPSALVKSFAEDPDGNIYIGTATGMAICDTEGNLSRIDDPRINEEYVRRLQTGIDGITYALTTNNNVFTLQGGKVLDFYETGKTLGVDNVHALLTDPENPGYLYLGDDTNHIWYGNLKDGFPKDKRISVAPMSYINSINIINGKLWVCTNDGICVFINGKLKKLESVPMTKNIESVTSDYQGNLWFASSKQGVMKLVPNQFTDVFDQYELEEAVVNSTCFYKGMLFVGTDSGFMALNNEGLIERININSAESASGDHLGDLNLITMLKDSRTRSIIKDSKDRIWISTFDEKYGLVRYDPESGNVICFREADGMPSKRIRAVYECSDGSYLAACTGGVAVIRDDKIEKIYGSESGINNTEILTVAEGPAGDILAGTDGGGIYVINSYGVKHITTDDGLMSDVIMRIKKVKSSDNYWLVTSNSIAYMTPEYEVQTIKNFPFSNNFDIYENSQGEAWILSSNGIYVVKAEELLRNEDINPVFYGIDNGIPNIANSNSYSYVTDSGVLYIAGTTGVTKVNIEKQFERVTDIKMSVPYVDADGVKIYPENGVITVPKGTKKITVYPYICSYTLMNPKVEYYLMGFDSSKSSTTKSDLKPIDYTNLKGGNYTFRMTISDSMGKESNEYRIEIVKARGFSEYLWFWLILILAVYFLLAILVHLYVKRKTDALVKKQEENKTLIREIVEAFAKMIDMKDKYTNGHSTRVAEYTALLARELGYNEETVEKYYNIALLHDIGKIGIPSEVLNKQGKLTVDEYHKIQSHTSLGYNVLKDISIMPELSVGAESHHERPDGKGYPQGLKGDEIPRVAQIIGVADAFDAMYSKRPYRERMNFEKVVSIIANARGTQLAEDVVDAFLRVVEQGGFRAPDDHGGGAMEDIDNIHKQLAKDAEQKKDDEGQS